MKIRDPLLLIGALLLLVCAACHETSRNGAGAPAPVRIGYQPNTHHVAEFLAMEKGWFAKAAGVPFTDREFSNGPAEMEAMFAGVLDMAYTGAAPAIDAVAAGLPIRIVAGASGEGSALVMREGFDYAGPESLVGAKVGCFPPGSIQHVIFTKWLADHGLSLDRLDMRYMGARELLEALSAKALDGAVMPDPFPQLAETRGVGRSVVVSHEMWPEHPCCVLVMTEDLIRSRPALAETLLAVHIAATRYAAEHPEETVDATVKKIRVAEPVCRAALPGNSTFATAPAAILPGVMEMTKIHRDLGLSKNREGKVVPVGAGELFDRELYERALKRVEGVKKTLGIE